jgi:hypothetical protein
MQQLEEMEKEDEQRRKLIEKRQMPPEAESLPPVVIQLKERTGTSITVGWDISEDLIDVIDELPVRPVYELAYRKAVAKRESVDDVAGGGDGATTAATTAASSSSSKKGDVGATAGAPLLMAANELWGYVIHHTVNNSYWVPTRFRTEIECNVNIFYLLSVVVGYILQNGGTDRRATSYRRRFSTEYALRNAMQVHSMTNMQ